MALAAAGTVTPMSHVTTTFYAFGDLRAFYCSALVAREGHDPYLAEPLGACERGLVGLQHTNLVLPAPIPGHVIALLEPLTNLNFPLVAAFWCALLACTWLALSAMLARLTSLSIQYALAACLPLSYAIPVFQGQVAPLAVALVVAGTVALRRNHDGIAACAVALSTLEPHIGLPACIALFVARPKARPFLIVAALAIGAITARTVGFAGILEYVGRVLPEHIASEARYDDQYSLTYVLSWFRMPLAAAIVLGSLSYWFVGAAAVAAAIRLSRDRNDVRYLLFVPMACSVLGGPYVHEEHLLAALPLAVLMATTTSGKARQLLTSALVLIALPALYVLRHILSAPAVMLHIPFTSVSAAPGPLRLLADASWAARVVSNAGHWPLLAAKVPSWSGLLIVVVAVALRAWSATPATSPLPAQNVNVAVGIP